MWLRRFRLRVQRQRIERGDILYARNSDGWCSTEDLEGLEGLCADQLLLPSASHLVGAPATAMSPRISRKVPKSSHGC